MLRAFLVASLLAVSAPSYASAVDGLLTADNQRGSATFRFLGLPLYEARLFTPGAAPLDWNQEFAIELRYLRNLSQYDLVEGTMREFQRLGSDLPVRDQLNTCFAKVSKGDRYLAVTDGPDRVSFWLNGQPTCTLTHPQIKQRFMSIFLGDNTRSERFTRRLRGQ